MTESLFNQGDLWTMQAWLIEKGYLPLELYPETEDHAIKESPIQLEHQLVLKDSMIYDSLKLLKESIEKQLRHSDSMLQQLETVAASKKEVNLIDAMGQPITTNIETVIENFKNNLQCNRYILALLEIKLPN